MTSLRQVALLCAAGALALVCSGCPPAEEGPETAGLTDTIHQDIPLLDRYGKPITALSKEPYSPRKTCGACHDIDEMANGYHFQQGRTDMTGKIITKDDYFVDGRKFLKSAGMYGKW